MKRTAWHCMAAMFSGAAAGTLAFALAAGIAAGQASTPGASPGPPSPGGQSESTATDDDDTSSPSRDTSSSSDDNSTTDSDRNSTNSTARDTDSSTRDSSSSTRSSTDNRSTTQNNRSSTQGARSTTPDFRGTQDNRDTTQGARTRDYRGTTQEYRGTTRDSSITQDYRDAARIDRDRATDRTTDDSLDSRFDRDDARFDRDESRTTRDSRQFDPNDSRFDRDAYRSAPDRQTYDRESRQASDRGDEYRADRDRTDRDEFQDRDNRDFSREYSREDRAFSGDFYRDNRDDTRDYDRDDRDFSQTRTYSREDNRYRTSAEFRADSVRSADIGLWFDAQSRDGLIISDIGASGAISRLGFREGDRIYSVNGVQVASERDFVRYLFDPRWRNQRVSVVIYRYGRPWTVYVQPSVLVQEYTTVSVDPLEQFGIVLDDRYDDYIVVWRVIPRSPAFYAGIRAGDVITTFDGRRVSSRDEFVNLVQQGNWDTVAVDVSRNRQTRRFNVDLAGSARTSSRTALRPDYDSEYQRSYDGSTGRRTEAWENDNRGFDMRTRDTQGQSDLNYGTRTTTEGYYQSGEVQGGIQGTVQPQQNSQPERRGLFNRFGR